MVGVNVVETSLKHAYNVQPYNKTLRTSALPNINLTLTLVIPMMRQLVQIELKLRFAAFSLAFSMLSGYILLLFRTIPKYLKDSTVSMSEFPIFIYPVQFTNIAFVLTMFIFNELSLQKAYRRFSKAYNSAGDGASKTRSSAYASINN